MKVQTIHKKIQINIYMSEQISDMEVQLCLLDAWDPMMYIIVSRGMFEFLHEPMRCIVMLQAGVAEILFMFPDQFLIRQ